MINITTTHTITCDNAPVEDVYRELDEKFPQLNPIIGQKLQLREERDDARSRANRLFEENKILSRDNGFAMRRIDALTDDVARRISRISELQAKVDELTRERDEAQKRLEESLAVEEKLIAENKSLAARDDALDGAFETQQMRINRLERKLKGAEDALTEHEPRPALPEGMRIAEHEEYGRLVVSPGTDSVGDFKVFMLDTDDPYFADYDFATSNTLTFLDSEPGPAPLPKPEDCKEGELYLARAFGRSVVANRCDPRDEHYPWIVSATDDNYADWCKDSQVTLLARLLPDRDIKEQA